MPAEKCIKSPFTSMLKSGANYKILKELGSGSYGRVYEAIDTTTNTKVAIKKFIKALAHPKLAQYCLRELEILTNLSHPNIVKKYKILRSSESVYIVMDYMPFDLKKLIRSPTFLDHAQVKALMYEILLGLNYMHSAKIVHRDIKPGNILATTDCKVKLCDFGLSRSICGLNITSYDFDEIYRREYADANEQNVVAGITASAESDMDIPEDLDEHICVNTTINKSGDFCVNMRKINRRKCEDYPLTKPKHPKEFGILHFASCDLVPEIRSREEEVKKPFNTVNVTVRRADLIKGLAKNSSHIERQLTSHIASRWYRAPEVILLEKVYNGVVDMWGVGCVFGELLQMLKLNKPNHKDRMPLFPGSSCFPLSPQLKPESLGKGQPAPQGDQLVTIFMILGTPSFEDISFVSDEGAKHYVNSLPKFPGAKFKQMFPECTEEELDLLQKLLMFNPYLRITVKEALNHPYFKGVRCKERETEEKPIALDVEAADLMCIQKLIEYCDKEKELSTKSRI